MAKINKDSLIHVELEKLEAKVNEFQTYLENNSILNFKPIDKDSTQDYQDKLHKEMLVQIKIQDAVFAWMPLLLKLRETEDGKNIETRGDIKIGGNFR